MRKFAPAWTLPVSHFCVIQFKTPPSAKSYIAFSAVYCTLHSFRGLMRPLRWLEMSSETFPPAECVAGILCMEWSLPRSLPAVVEVLLPDGQEVIPLAWYFSPFFRSPEKCLFRYFFFVDVAVFCLTKFIHFYPIFVWLSFVTNAKEYTPSKWVYCLDDSQLFFRCVNVLKFCDMSITGQIFNCGS
jgi:hypothetical protein